FAIRHGSEHAERFHEHWPDEPELIQFLEDKIGLEVGESFRGSVHFWPFDYDTGLTASSLWARGIPTVLQYGELVTPESYYFVDAIQNKSGYAGSNGFVPSPGLSWMNYWRVLQLLGARYYIAGHKGLPLSLYGNFPISMFPYRRVSGEHGLWYV